MPFDVFKTRLRSKFGNEIHISFHSSNGKFFANLPTGVTVVGNPHTQKVWVKWGSGHSALAEI